MNNIIELEKKVYREKSWICHIIDLCSIKNESCCLQMLKTLLEKDKNEQQKFGGEVFLFISEKLNTTHGEDKYLLYQKILKIIFDYYTDEDKFDFLYKLVRIKNVKAFTTIKYCLNELDVVRIDNVRKDSILSLAAKDCQDESVFKEILKKYSLAMGKNFLSFIKQESIIKKVFGNKELTIDAVAGILFEDQSFDINTVFWNGRSLLKSILCSKRVNEHSELIEKILQIENLNVNDGVQLYLHTVCKEKEPSLKVIKMFFKYQRNKIDYRQIDNSGKTAIFYTCSKSKVFDYLLQQDVFDLRWQDDKHMNILHHYCKLKNCNRKIVEKILESSHKEDSLSIIYDKDELGNRPHFYAHPRKTDNYDIADLVKPKG